MLKSYFKVAWRNLWKHTFHSLINIIGLAIGLIFVLLIYAYIWQEKAVNADLKNINNQYMIGSEYKKPGYGIPLTTIGALPKALKEEYPHLVADYYRFDGINCIISKDEKVFEESGALGDSTLLTMYGFDLIEGDPVKALEEPFSVVITEEVAIKYFGTNSVLNNLLTIRNFSGEKHDFKITGVLKSRAENSIINLNAGIQNSVFLPLSNAAYFGRSIENWNNVYIASFIELQSGVSPEMLKDPINQLLRKHADPQLAANLVPVLKPLKTYHLDDNGGALRKMLWTLSLIAAFILLMAIINFINITISKATGRLKEIGVRKLMGSKKSQLIFQLGVESLILVLIAGLFSLFLYPLLAPLFSIVLGKQLLSFTDLPFMFFLYYMLGILVIGILAGIYPALRLTNVKIIYSIKGRFLGNEKTLVRKMLLGFQFIVAMVVLISAVIISKQVSMFFGKDIGYDKDYLITAQVPRDWTESGLNHMESIRSSLSSIPAIENITISYDVPGAPGSGTQNIFTESNKTRNGITVQTIMSDEYYSDTYGIPLLAGDFFSKTKGSTNGIQKVVITSKAAKALGFNSPESAVGESISMNDGAYTAVVAGIAEDFYFNSMHGEMMPIIWLNVRLSNQYRYFTIRLKPGSISSSLGAIETKWKELMPDAPFEYKFLDSTLEKIYQTELQLKRASALATVLAAFIVFLGIIGLVSLSIQQRVKEIGIRKVLGASVSKIISLFLNDFIAVFLVAVLIACPLAYVMMNKWLANYYLKTDLHILFFIGPIGLLGIMAALLIGFQSVKAALANPVNSLRDE